MAISRKLAHAAREQLQIIMGNLDLLMGVDDETDKYAEKAKAAVRTLAQLLKSERVKE
jgi:hypothetical protein